MPAVQRYNMRIYYCIAVVLSLVLSIFFGQTLTFEIQKALAGVLSGISSILFGVLGIWIGIMAPDSLRQIYSSKNGNERAKSWRSLESLYKPVFLSLVVFIIVTVFIFVGQFIKVFNFFIIHKDFLRRVGTFTILTSMFLTINLVFLSVRPGIEMLAKSFSFIKRADKMDEMYPEKKEES